MDRKSAAVGQTVGRTPCRAVFCTRSVSNMIAGVQGTVIVVKQREFRAHVNRAVAVQQLLCPPAVGGGGI